MDERFLHYVIENGARLRCCSEPERLKTAEDTCRAGGTRLPGAAGAGSPDEERAAALLARAPPRFFSVRDGDLAALFDFYLSADRLGLAEEARALILKTQGEETLAQIKRISREALGCRLFYGADDSEVQAEDMA
jgi:hypothetical protein